MRAVAAGEYAQESVLSTWRKYQEDTADSLASALGTASKVRLKVLVATYVANERRAVKLWSDNVQRLQGNTAGDRFDFAFFHHDGNRSLWTRQRWYREPFVRLKYLGAGCPPTYWRMLNASFTSDYDYVWLMDEDIHLGFFSWDVYRGVLLRLRPLVSQPSVVSGSASSKKSSNLVEMRMKSSLGRDKTVVAREASRSEVMTPVLATKVWEAVLKRLEGNNLHNSWFTDTFWDLAPLVGKVTCGLPGIVLIDASPVRHMDFRSLRSPDRPSPSAGCTFGSGAAGMNNRSMRADELQLLASTLQDKCGQAALFFAHFTGRPPKRAHCKLSALSSSGPGLRSWSAQELK